jgi:KaiC/GvpD/RAD55 family RecA-like ATPase
MNQLTQNNTKAEIPFSDLGTVLLDCIFNALSYIIDLEIKEISIKDKGRPSRLINLSSSDENLRKFFEPFLNHKTNKRQGINPHFSAGNKKKEGFELRITRILLQTYREVQEDSKSGQGFCIPSPLYVLYQILTVPDEPQSSAYAVLFCRSLLFETFKVFPDHPLTPNKYSSFNISDVNTSLNTFISITSINQNIPISENVPTQVMLAHYLAMKGIFYLRFGSIGRQETAKDKKYILSMAKKYLESKSIIGNPNQKKSFEFHKLSFYDELPESATLMNELCGIPIPIRGAETIFQGGVRTDSNSNLVLRISGEPGSGKTTFALALCAAMSPFNTFTYYISLEENPKDLKNRLYSLIPGYLKKMSIYNDDVDSWFVPEKAPLASTNRLEYFEAEYIDRIYERLIKKSEQKVSISLPAVCPLIIVIDSVRILLNEEKSNLDRFIEKCKKLNAVIILISANDERFHQEIDYLVDLVVHLKHSGTNSQKEKPTRILQLSKTRHQISRPGSHVFHLSGEKGLRISPQLPSQIDKKEKISKPIASSEYYINFFNEYKTDKTTNRSNVKIWDKSQILLHGYGSSGKAGLSLSILLSPLKSDKNSLSDDNSLYLFRRKVLVISLLYPEKYYKDLKSRISKRIQPNTDEKDIKSTIDCLYFYSGYITPEDFISRILRKLDAAILEGEPFTGVLLDGLHNVSLQFYNLRENDMIWPALYSLLVKYHLTIVTTFTNFLIDNENKSGSSDDNEILLKGHKPLLHGLVQASDYLFTVQPPEIKHESKYTGKYIVNLKSAIRHKLKNEKFVWDRETVQLQEYAIVTQAQIDFE